MSESTRDFDYDIVIAGGGLVGASLAVALRDTRWRVAVVEPIPPQAEAQPSFDDRQTALAPTSRRFFENLGLWQAIEAKASPIRRIHVSDRGHGGFTRLDAAEEGLPALGHVAPNRVLGAVLAPAMAEAADVFCPARITQTHPVMEPAEAESDPDAARAPAAGDPAGHAASSPAETQAVARQVVIETESGPQTVSTRLLVVADGMRSTTREALGIGLDERDYGQSAIIANLRTQHPHHGTAYERFTPDGPLAVLPAGQDAASMVWTLAHDEARAAATEWSEAKFLESLQTAFGWRLGRLEAVGKRQVYPLWAVTADQFCAQRAVIMGNAAHALHPVAGQGFNLALRDVAGLVEALGGDTQLDEPGAVDDANGPAGAGDTGSLADAADAGRAADPGDPDRLAAYARSRRSDYRRTFTFTDGLVRLFSNEFLPLVAARNVGLTLLDLFPPARRALLKQATGAAGDVPALCRDPV
jgi:2-octaprenyl-6-methoxyphenol hydroxylase